MEGKGPGPPAPHCLPPILGLRCSTFAGTLCVRVCVRKCVTLHSRNVCFCVCVSSQVWGVDAAPLEMFGWMVVLKRNGALAEAAELQLLMLCPPSRWLEWGGGVGRRGGGVLFDPAQTHPTLGLTEWWWWWRVGAASVLCSGRVCVCVCVCGVSKRRWG